MKSKYFIVIVDCDVDFTKKLKNSISLVFDDFIKVFSFDNFDDALFVSNNVSMAERELLLFCVGSKIITKERNKMEKFYTQHPATNYVIFDDNQDFEIIRYCIGNFGIFRLFAKDYNKSEFELALFESIKYYENNKLAKTYQKLIESTITSRLKEINELNSKLTYLANTDPLTNIHNRRFFFDTVDIAFNFAKRNTIPFGLLMIDIDDFKKINDNFGHQMGDEVLKRLSKILTNTVRNSDIIARFGGEEFILVLQESTELSLISVANKLIELIREQINTDGFIPRIISVSIGCSLFCSSDKNIDDIIKRADDALYQAKNNGKNQVRFISWEDL